MIVEPPISFFRVSVHGVNGTDTFQQQQVGMDLHNGSAAPSTRRIDPALQSRFAVSVAHSSLYTVPLSGDVAPNSAPALVPPTASRGGRQWALIPQRSAENQASSATTTSTPSSLGATADALISSTFATPSAVTLGTNNGMQQQQQNAGGLYDKCGRVHVEVWELPSFAQLVEKVQAVTTNNTPSPLAAVAAKGGGDNDAASRDAEYLANLLLLGSMSHQQKQQQGVPGVSQHASGPSSLRSVLDTMTEMQSISLVAENQFSLLDVATKVNPAAAATNAAPMVATPVQNLPLNRRAAQQVHQQHQQQQQVTAVACIEHLESSPHADVTGRLPLSSLRQQAAAAQMAATSPQMGMVGSGGMLQQQQQQQQLPIVSMGLIHFVSDEVLAAWKESQIANGLGSISPNTLDTASTQLQQQSAAQNSSGSLLHPFLEGGSLTGSYWASLPVEAHSAATFLNGGMLAYESNVANTTTTTTTTSAQQMGTPSRHGGVSVLPGATRRNLTPLFSQPPTASAQQQPPHSLSPAVAMDTSVNLAVVRSAAASRVEFDTAVVAYERKRQQLVQQFADHQQQQQQATAGDASPSTSGSGGMMRIINSQGEEVLVPAGNQHAMTNPQQFLDDQKRFVDANLGPKPALQPAETVGASSFSMYDLCKWLVRFDLLTNTPPRKQQSQQQPSATSSNTKVGGSASLSSFRIQHNANDGSVTVYLPLVSSARTAAAAAAAAATGGSPFVLVIKIHSLPWFLHLLQGGPCPYYFNRITNPSYYAAMQYQAQAQQQHNQQFGNNNQQYQQQQQQQASQQYGQPLGVVESYTQKYGYRFLSASMVASIFRLKIRAAMARYALGRAVVDPQYAHAYPLIASGGGGGGAAAGGPGSKASRTQHLLPLSNATANCTFGTQELFTARRNFLGAVQQRYAGAARGIATSAVGAGAGTFLTTPAASVGVASPYNNTAVGGLNESELIATEFAATFTGAELVSALLKVQYFQLVATAEATTAMDHVAAEAVASSNNNKAVTNLVASGAAASGSSSVKKQQQHGAKYVLWSHRRCSRVLTLLYSTTIEAPRGILSWHDPVASGIVTAIYVALCLFPQLVIPCIIIASVYFLVAPGVDIGQPAFLQRALGEAKGREEEPAGDEQQQLKADGNSAGGANKVANAVRRFLSVPDINDDADHNASGSAGGGQQNTPPHSPTRGFGSPYSVSSAGFDAYGAPLSPSRSVHNAGYRSFGGGGGGNPAVGTMFDDSMQLYGSFGHQSSSFRGGGQFMGGSGMFGGYDNRQLQQSSNSSSSALLGERASAAVAQQAELQRLTEQLLQATNAIAELVDRVHGVLLWRSPIISLLIAAELLACLMLVLFSPATWITALALGLSVLVPVSPVRYVLLYTMNLVVDSPALSNCKFIAMN